MKYFYLFLVLMTTFCVATPLDAAPPKQHGQTLSVRYKTIRKQRAGRYDISVRYPIFTGSSPVIRLANTSIRMYVTSRVNTLIKDTESDFAGQGNLGVSDGYSLELEPTISLARPNLISIYFVDYTYMGGAHPSTDFPSQSFGIVNGKAKKLTLADLFAKNRNPNTVLSAVALPKLKAHGASSVTTGSIKTLNEEALRNWVITPRAITLLFAPYSVASYAEGPFITKIELRELDGNWNNNGPLQDLLTDSSDRETTP